MENASQLNDCCCSNRWIINRIIFPIQHFFYEARELTHIWCRFSLSPNRLDSIFDMTHTKKYKAFNDSTSVFLPSRIRDVLNVQIHWWHRDGGVCFSLHSGAVNKSVHWVHSFSFHFAAVFSAEYVTFHICDCDNPLEIWMGREISDSLKCRFESWALLSFFALRHVRHRQQGRRRRSWWWWVVGEIIILWKKWTRGKTNVNCIFHHPHRSSSHLSCFCVRISHCSYFSALLST